MKLFTCFGQKSFKEKKKLCNFGLKKAGDAATIMSGRRLTNMLINDRIYFTGEEEEFSDLLP